MQRILILGTVFLSVSFALIVLLEFGLERRETQPGSRSEADVSAELAARHVLELLQAGNFEAVWECLSFESKLSYQIQLDALRKDNMNRSFLLGQLGIKSESLDSTTAKDYYIRVAKFVESGFKKVLEDHPEGSTPFAGPMKSCKVQGRLATVAYERPSGPEGCLYLVLEPGGWRAIISGSVWATD